MFMASHIDLQCLIHPYKNIFFPDKCRKKQIPCTLCKPFMFLIPLLNDKHGMIQGGAYCCDSFQLQQILSFQIASVCLCVCCLSQEDYVTGPFLECYNQFK